MNLIAAFLVALTIGPVPPAAAQTTRESVMRASDKAHKDLAREAGELDMEEPAAAPEPPARPKPRVRPAPVAAPEPKEEPAPAPLPVQPPAKKRLEVPVTVYWHMADDADVYLNGKPLREYSPSFKTRGDEAPRPAFSTPALLADGDVFTVGGRRGGSYGLMLIAADLSGRVVFMTDKDSWKAYQPGERADWYEPAAAQASPASPVVVQPDPWGPQKELNKKYGDKALSIWSSPSDTFAYLTAVVRLAKAGPRSDGAVSLRSLNHPGHLLRVRDSLAVFSDAEKEEAAFKKVPGLADAAGVSFESADHPGHFLRHQGFQLKLHKDSGDALFKADATFHVRAGLADPSASSFESFNYPGHFVRHRDAHFFIEKDPGGQFRTDATFKLVDAPAR